MSLLRQGKATALTIYLGESDQWQGMPLYVAIVQLLREHRCAGATVTRAIAGYGAGARLHESGHLRLSSDASLIIQVIDQPERLHRLLPQLQEMLNGGLVTMQDVEVLKYSHARRYGLPAKLTVRQVMETMVTTVSLDTPVSAIIEELLEAPFRALPVIDNERRLQGIISTGDLINAGILPLRRGLVRTALELDQLTAASIRDSLEKARQSKLTARDIMNRQVRTIAPDVPVREAARVMLETGLRRLPVIADGILIGMVGRADLLQAVVTSPLMSAEAASATQPLPRTGSLPPESVQQRPLSEYLNPDVPTVSEQASLDDVFDALILSPLKRVIVIDVERRVKGIISDVDVLAHMQEQMRPRLLSLLTGWATGKQHSSLAGTALPHTGKAQVAADIMNPGVIMIPDTASVQEAIEEMIATRRKLLPVVNAQGQLVGTLSRSDLLRALAEG